MTSILSRVCRWGLTQAGSASTLLLLLVLSVVASTALGVADRVRGLDDGMALGLSAVGLSVGWALSAAGLSAGWTAAVGGLLGLIAVPVCVGKLGGPLLAAARAWGRLALDVPVYLARGAELPVAQALETLAPEGEALRMLLLRLQAWGTAAISGSTSGDLAAISLVWGLFLWVAAGWAGWMIYRRREPLLAVGPCGTLLFVVFYHVWGSHVALLSLLTAAFLLMALISYEGRVRRWRAARVDYPELRPQTLVWTLFLSLSLVTVAQTVPSLPLGAVLRPAPDVAPKESADARGIAALVGLNAAEQSIVGAPRAAGLPRRHLVGSGPELADQVVMLVTVENPPAGPATGSSRATHYWRSHSYDVYSGSGWEASALETVPYEAGARVAEEALRAQRIIRQRVQRVDESSQLAYAPGTIMVTDQDYAVVRRSSYDPFAVTVEGRAYRLDSTVPAAGVAALRGASGSYPNWVRSRYLALPETVPERVLALARDLTVSAESRYDRARAIERYLRRLPYSLDVPAPPAGRDVVDTFLFDYRRGYCDYYASAMVVLARAVGLPSRLAVGYAPGTYDAAEGHYVVTEADAHSWPEIYFPSYGWVKFEPTSGLPPLDRSEEVAFDEPEQPLQSADGRWVLLQWVGRLMLGAVVTLCAALVVWVATEDRRLQGQDAPALAGTLYHRLCRLGRWLNVPLAQGCTPREVASTVAAWVSQDGRMRSAETEGRQRLGLFRGVRQSLLQQMELGSEDVIWLGDLYGRAVYGLGSLTVEDRTEALHVWRQLRWRLVAARLLRRLGLVRSDEHH